MSGTSVDFRLGVGDHAHQKYDFYQIRHLQNRLREFPEKVCRTQSMWSVGRAAKIGKIALQARVGRLGRHTGNLLRAITVKKKNYKNTKQGGLPVAVAVIGFRRSGTGDSKKVPGGQIRIGNDRAFHAHLVEFGTIRRHPGKSRLASTVRNVNAGRKTTTATRNKDTVSSPYAVMSSWNTGGPFRLSKAGMSPAYPQAFFAKIDPAKGLGAMPALHPVKRAFDASSAIMGRVLEEAMTEAIGKAMKQVGAH